MFKITLMEKSMNDREAIRAILQGAVGISVLLAYLSSDFFPTFNQIWGAFGSLIGSAIIIEAGIRAVVKACEWIGKRFGGE